MTQDFKDKDEKVIKELSEFREREEELLVKTLAGSRYKVPYIDLSATTIQNEALRLVTEPEARRIGVAPFKVVGKAVNLAVISPTAGDTQTFIDDLGRQGYGPISVFMASHASLERAWGRYAELSASAETMKGGIDVSGEILDTLQKEIHGMEDIKTKADKILETHDKHAISHLLEIILAGAISLKCSDIHLEAEEKRMRVRFRLDGVLQDVLFMDPHIYHLLNARIKLIAGLKLTITTKAQDGGFSIFVSGLEIRMRTSTVPGSYGESIVMRILDPRSIQGDLANFGIEPRLFKIIEEEIKKPNGLILITGPTGSGKTTTLYAFLRKIYSPEIKIMTIEDPVEYHLDGIVQTQTEQGYNFLAGLRAALRQDPDVIMVGEIRDGETAKIAVEAALTGHIVFSTLHTNNAAGVIPRLIDLDVNAKILVSALRLSIAQRLVRKLCKYCKKERATTEEEKILMARILKGASDAGKNLAAYNLTADQDIKLFSPVGCKECNNTGYKGRVGIFEAIVTDEAIEKIIPSSPSERECRSPCFDYVVRDDVVNY